MSSSFAGKVAPRAGGTIFLKGSAKAESSTFGRRTRTRVEWLEAASADFVGKLEAATADFDLGSPDE
jgi:hypothetical protein